VGIVGGAADVETLATGVRVITSIYTVVGALAQLGIPVELTAPTFLVMLAWAGERVAK
jgi:hypothetical protein